MHDYKVLTSLKKKYILQSTQFFFFFLQNKNIKTINRLYRTNRVVLVSYFHKKIDSEVLSSQPFKYDMYVYTVIYVTDLPKMVNRKGVLVYSPFHLNKPIYRWKDLFLVLLSNCFASSMLKLQLQTPCIA